MLRSSSSLKLVVGAGGGGGGGGGTVTFTLVFAVTVPLSLRAVSVYEVVLLGNTCRVPLPCTAPIPGSMLTDVASFTDQRSVAACPRSIDDGSAVNCAIEGLGGGGGGGVS